MRRLDPDRPDRRLAFASGSMGQQEAAVFEEHLASCPDCVVAVEALRRMIEGARRGHRRDSEACPALTIPSGAWSATDLRRIGNHLGTCAACANELETLRRDARSELARTTAESLAVQPAPLSRPRRAILAVAGAAIVGLVAWGVAAMLDRPAVDASMARLDFVPARRSTGHGPRAETGRPYELRVFLPYGAPRLAYRLRLQSATEPGAILLDAPVASDGEGIVRFHYLGFARPGRHRLTLVPARGDGAAVATHEFDVARRP